MTFYFADCDNWEDPKKLWYKYHEFNKDIYLFKNQENQEKKPKVRMFFFSLWLRNRLLEPVLSHTEK